MEEKCPFFDFCQAAGRACTKNDLKEFCQPVFESRLEADKEFVRSRILFQQNLSPEEFLEIETILQNRERALVYLPEIFPILATP